MVMASTVPELSSGSTGRRCHRVQVAGGGMATPFDGDAATLTADQPFGVAFVFNAYMIRPNPRGAPYISRSGAGGTLLMTSPAPATGGHIATQSLP